MKKLLLFAALAPLLAGAATLTVDKVQQRYPWNGLVDIDYTVALESGETLSAANDRIEFSVTDNAAAKTYVPVRFLQVPLPMSAGQHRVTWDANYDGVTFKSSDVTVTASLCFYPEEYMEIDVSGGTSAEYWPVAYRNGKPINGYTSGDAYRTGVIVLRKVPAGSFVAGVASGTWGYLDRATQHPVTISKPFYISIFHISQQQYEYVMGSTPSSWGATYPVCNLSWNGIRGGTWPNGSPDSTSFMGKLRAKCRARDAQGDYTVTVDFDLPTEYQWEYAARAGTTTPFGDGAEISSDADAAASIARMGVANASGPQPVGSKQPNDWGIYDMHGNVYDILLDWYDENVHTLKQYVDPVGPSTSTGSRVRRGGFWGEGASSSFCSSAMRGGDAPGTVWNRNGIRLACPAGE